jgi:hypothetical protein
MERARRRRRSRGEGAWPGPAPPPAARSRHSPGGGRAGRAGWCSWWSRRWWRCRRGSQLSNSQPDGARRSRAGFLLPRHLLPPVKGRTNSVKKNISGLTNKYFISPKL